MKKKLLSILLSLVMLLTVLPTAAFAAEIDKTATQLENEQTTVTLSVGGSQTVENVAVLFVLDYSTSVTVRDAAGEFLTELASKQNTNIKAAVVDYSSVAASTDWTTINSETDTSSTGLLKSQTSGGTNYHAGLLKAQEMLASSEIAGYTTYLITISDGITYLWTDDDSTSDTYGQTMSVWYQNNGNGESDIQNGNSVYEMKYGSGNAIPDDQFNALVSGTDEIVKKYNDTIVKAEPYATTTKPDPSETDRFFSYYDNATKDEVKENYLIGSEIAIYKTASVYKELVNSVDYAFAFKMDENHWTSYPYGQQLMDYLIELSDKDSGTIADSTAATVFSSISDQILYEIMKGTVTDVIGDDFDWIGMETVKLSVGGTELEGTVDGNTVTFGGGNYVVTYYSDDTENGTGEYFTWEIKVPVQAAAGLTLSYDLKLADDYELPEGKSYEIVPTNEEATIKYTDPEGEEKKDEFPVPTVTVGEKTSEPGLDKVIVTDDGETDQDDVAAGDTVNFKLTSTVPSALSDYIDYTAGEGSTSSDVTVQGTVKTDAAYTLTFHDVMDDGLSYTANSLTVYVGNKVLESDDYTFTTENLEDDCTFEVSLDLLALYTAGIIKEDDFGITSITVTYSATLDEDAAAGAYYNTAWVSYPDDESEKDKVEVDTYGISIFKKDQSTEKGLAGAEFTLTYPDGTTTVTLTSDKDGYISVEGLDVGTYTLVETKAPEGYVASSTPITIEIKADVDGNTNLASVTVANAPIPSTGGMGTTMYTIGGLCILLAAGTLYLFTRRRRTCEK